MDTSTIEILDMVLAPLRMLLFLALWPFYLIFGGMMLWGDAQVTGNA